MSIKIQKKIVGYSVGAREEERATETAAAESAVAEDSFSNVIQMHEKLERPDHLVGNTYKIKTPLSEHALYVTINDMVLNEGTDHEHRRPFEIFINSKNMDHFQWIVALTRIVSAVFRKGGDVTFLVEELRSVFDPRGGYFKKGGKYMPSLVAEIGDCIECHLKEIGMLGCERMDESQRAFLEKKRAEFEGGRTAVSTEPKAITPSAAAEKSSSFPAGSQLCNKCSTKAVIKMDGCMTCLNCGDSKCG
jgi:hypothetical protein